LEVRIKDSKETEKRFVGISVADIMSDKPDRKEQSMEEGKDRRDSKTGRFLNHDHSHPIRRRRIRRWVMVIMLLAWDGLLLHMIVHCLIEPVYGAAFVAVVSVNLGYQL